MRTALALLLAAPAALTAPPGSPAGAPHDWPEYRGPRADGHAPGALPLTWSESEGVAWKTAIHGRGWSSPVVHDGRVWLTTADPEGHEQSVLCVDLASGKVLLDRVLFRNEEPAKRNKLNSYASPSPVVEPGRVYLHFGSYGTVCLDARSFEEQWRRSDLNCDHMEGPGSSPILFADLFIVHVDGGDVQYITALDKQTGADRWRTERSVDYTDVALDMRKSYSTPLVVEVGGQPQLVSSFSGGTCGYEPRTGIELWRVRHKGFSMSSRPLLGDGCVYVSTGFMRPELWQLRLGGEGDVTDTHVGWRVVRGIPTMPSPVLADGLIYTVSDGGVASCLDAASGEERWRKRVGGDYSASVLYAEGRVYFFDRVGRTTVVKAGDEFEELTVNQLDAGFMASAAVAEGALLLRTETHLYRVDAARER
jgi:outer membrane protein assembly factor BamB